MAVGPSGAGSGDNPSGAWAAIDSSTATEWSTDWYQSAAFGNLQAGTGLLIDMGRAVTITSVRIQLGPEPGANLQLSTASVADLAQFRVQASATDAAATVSLTMANPEPARYLLIWFTLLPPDSAGTFQATVYDVSLEGTP